MNQNKMMGNYGSNGMAGLQGGVLGAPTACEKIISQAPPQNPTQINTSMNNLEEQIRLNETLGIELDKRLVKVMRQEPGKENTGDCGYGVSSAPLAGTLDMYTAVMRANNAKLVSILTLLEV